MACPRPHSALIFLQLFEKPLPGSLKPSLIDYSAVGSPSQSLHHHFVARLSLRTCCRHPGLGAQNHSAGALPCLLPVAPPSHSPFLSLVVHDEPRAREIVPCHGG